MSASPRHLKHAEIGEIRLLGRLEVATLVGPKALLAVVSELDPGGDETVSGWLVDGDRTRRLRGSSVPLGNNGSDEDRALLVLHQVGRDEGLGEGGTLVLESRDGPVGLAPTLDELAVPLEQLGPDYLSELDARTRATVLDEISGTLVSKIPVSPRVATGLRALRDALRPKLPSAHADPTSQYAAHVDGLWRIDRSSFYVKGWVYGNADLADAELVTPEGWRIGLEGAFRHPRSDVSTFFGASPRQQLGFIAFVEAPGDCVLPSGWILELGCGGRAVEVGIPDVVDDPVAAQTVILHDVENEQLPDDALRARHARPALTRLGRRVTGSVGVEAVDEFGEPPPQPDATIIVPLYREIGFLEHQMAQFVHDPSISDCDLVYVLDSPEDAAQVRRLAQELFPLYRVPFRLAVLTGNGGFAVVNNVGASLARGRLLVLMNSDVLPDQPGWLPRMAEFYDSTPDIGALGPKLLYEDESIQHAGLYFERTPGSHVWSNEHYFKGLHRDFPAANVARSVPAVTGACLMISAELYDELGGLSGQYIRGDYEDSDLCLRLRELGRESWYLPDVALYHLEGQSYPTAERALTSDYNKWLHTHIWRTQLGAASAEP